MKDTVIAGRELTLRAAVSMRDQRREAQGIQRKSCPSAQAA